jgi:hypothetical protein
MRLSHNILSILVISASWLLRSLKKRTIASSYSKIIKKYREVYALNAPSCEHTSILRALVEYPQGNLEEIQQKTL